MASPGKMKATKGGKGKEQDVVIPVAFVTFQKPELDEAFRASHAHSEPQDGEGGAGAHASDQGHYVGDSLVIHFGEVAKKQTNEDTTPKAHAPWKHSDLMAGLRAAIAEEDEGEGGENGVEDNPKDTVAGNVANNEGSPSGDGEAQAVEYFFVKIPKKKLSTATMSDIRTAINDAVIERYGGFEDPNPNAPNLRPDEEHVETGKSISSLVNTMRLGGLTPPSSPAATSPKPFEGTGGGPNAVNMLRRAAAKAAHLGNQGLLGPLSSSQNANAHGDGANEEKQQQKKFLKNRVFSFLADVDCHNFVDPSTESRTSVAMYNDDLAYSLEILEKAEADMREDKLKEEEYQRIMGKVGTTDSSNWSPLSLSSHPKCLCFQRYHNRALPHSDEQKSNHRKSTDGDGAVDAGDDSAQKPDFNLYHCRWNEVQKSLKELLVQHPRLCVCVTESVLSLEERTGDLRILRSMENRANGFTSYNFSDVSVTSAMNVVWENPAIELCCRNLVEQQRSDDTSSRSSRLTNRIETSSTPARPTSFQPSLMPPIQGDPLSMIQRGLDSCRPPPNQWDVTWDYNEYVRVRTISLPIKSDRVESASASAFVPKLGVEQLFVFGGASKEAVHNSLFVLIDRVCDLDLDTRTVEDHKRWRPGDPEEHPRRKPKSKQKKDNTDEEKIRPLKGGLPVLEESQVNMLKRDLEMKMAMTVENRRRLIELHKVEEGAQEVESVTASRPASAYLNPEGELGETEAPAENGEDDERKLQFADDETPPEGGGEAMSEAENDIDSNNDQTESGSNWSDVDQDLNQPSAEGEGDSGDQGEGEGEGGTAVAPPQDLEDKLHEEAALQQWEAVRTNAENYTAESFVRPDSKVIGAIGPHNKWRFVQVVCGGKNKPHPRYAHSMVKGQNGYLVLFGGDTGVLKSEELASVGACQETILLSDTWLFQTDPDYCSWYRVCQDDAPSPCARAHHMVCTYGSEMLMFGGRTYGDRVLGDTWLFHMKDHTWSNISSVVSGKAPCPRARASICKFGRKSVLLFGGFGSGDGNKGKVHMKGNTPMRTDSARSMSIDLSRQVTGFEDLRGFGFLYNDIHILDLEYLSWSSPRLMEGVPPSPCHGATALAVGQCVLVLGGSFSRYGRDSQRGLQTNLEVRRVLDQNTWRVFDINAPKQGGFNNEIFKLDITRERRGYKARWIRVDSCMFGQLEVMKPNDLAVTATSRKRKHVPKKRKKDKKSADEGLDHLLPFTEPDRVELGDPLMGLVLSGYRNMVVGEQYRRYLQGVDVEELLDKETTASLPSLCLWDPSTTIIAHVPTESYDSVMAGGDAANGKDTAKEKATKKKSGKDKTTSPQPKQVAGNNKKTPKAEKEKGEKAEVEEGKELEVQTIPTLNSEIVRISPGITGSASLLLAAVPEQLATEDPDWERVQQEGREETGVDESKEHVVRGGNNTGSGGAKDDEKKRTVACGWSERDGHIVMAFHDLIVVAGGTNGGDIFDMNSFIVGQVTSHLPRASFKNPTGAGKSKQKGKPKSEEVHWQLKIPSQIRPPLFSFMSSLNNSLKEMTMTASAATPSQINLLKGFIRTYSQQLDATLDDTLSWGFGEGSLPDMTQLPDIRPGSHYTTNAKAIMSGKDPREIEEEAKAQISSSTTDVLTCSGLLSSLPPSATREGNPHGMEVIASFPDYEMPSVVGHSSVMYNGHMVLFGGQTDAWKTQNDIYVLNTKTRVWKHLKKVKGMIPSGRWGHTANVIGTSMYIFGGAGAAKQAGTKFVGTQLGLNNETRVKLGLGQQDSKRSIQSPKFNAVFRFNLETLEWTRVTPTGAVVPQARYGHSCVRYNRTLVVFGGICDESTYSKNTRLNDVFSLTFTGDGMYISFSESVPLTRWAIDNPEWRRVAASGTKPSARAWHGCTIVEDQREMIVCGGSTGEGENKKSPLLMDIYSLNLGTYVWQKIRFTGDSPCPRLGHSFMSVTQTKCVLVGGLSDGKVVRKEVFVYDAASHHWTQSFIPANLQSREKDDFALSTPKEKMSKWQRKAAELHQSGGTDNSNQRQSSGTVGWSEEKEESIGRYWHSSVASGQRTGSHGEQHLFVWGGRP